MIVYHFAVNDLRIQLKYLRIYILGGLVAPQTPDSGNKKNHDKKSALPEKDYLLIRLNEPGKARHPSEPLRMLVFSRSLSLASSFRSS